MKIKVVINGKTVEIEIDRVDIPYYFKYDHSPEQLKDLLSSIIKELKA
jgi:transcription initiation factor IIE alpha subunit